MPRPSDVELGRRGPQRKVRRYLIVTEDSKSALDYLLAFKIPPTIAKIVPEGGAGNTICVVERGIELRDEAIRAGEPFVHTWCVFDRDEHPLDRYKAAFRRAQGEDSLSAIWANEAFELWYLLHFCYRNTAIDRHELKREISKPDRLNRKYEKCDGGVFALLNKPELRAAALRNARNLERVNPSPLSNPSLNIHRLIQTLLDLQSAAAESP
jgi:hypothetical protein